MMEVSNDHEFFYKFYNSGLHGALWPSGHTWGIVVLYFVDGYNCALYCKNETDGKHVEELLLEGVLQVLSGRPWTELQAVRMYINVSPCFQCSDKIEKFFADAIFENNDLKMEVVFAAPYKWLREYCWKNCRKRHKFPQPDDHHKQISGLRDLCMYSKSLTIRTFGDNDWHLLAKNFGVTKMYKFERRRHEDALFNEDFRLAIGLQNEAAFPNAPRIQGGAYAIQPQTPEYMNDENIGNPTGINAGRRIRPLMIRGAAVTVDPNPVEDDDSYIQQGPATNISMRKKGRSDAPWVPPSSNTKTDPKRPRTVQVDGRHRKLSLKYKTWIEL